MSRQSLKPRLSKEAICRKEDFGGLLFDLNTARIYSLNRTAYRVVELCNGEKTTEEITQEISNEFADIPAQLEEEIDRFIQELMARKMIVIE